MVSPSGNSNAASTFAVINTIPAAIAVKLQQVAKPAHLVCLMILIRFSGDWITA
jgi:hypothetical protein